MQDAIQPPSPAGLLAEARTVLELPRLLLRSPALAQMPRGEGERVLVLPGYGAGDGSTALLRAYLAWLGYRPRGWGLGRNRGDVPELMPRVAERLVALAEADGAPIPLIGWSLGGYLAREAARDRPDAARQVITLGSPVVGGPKYTAVAAMYRRQGVDLDEIEAQVAARHDQPLHTPVTALYSRRDAVVAWRACIDEHGRATEHVEVDTTNIGLGFSARIFEIVAHALVAGRSAREAGS